MKRFTIVITVLLIASFGVSLCSVSAVAAERKSCREILDELAQKHAGQFDKIVAKFQKEALEGNNPARAFYILGIAYDIKGLKNEARNYYRRSLQLKPDHNPARKFLDHLDGNEAACNVAEEKSAALVDATVISGVSPLELADNYSRYKGQLVALDGWILDDLNRKQGKYEIICSTLPSGAGTSADRMDGYFLVRSISEIKSDRRIARGARISVRGTVVDREFLKSPVTKEMSKDRKVVIEPEGIKVENEGVSSGPLTLRLK